MKKYLINFKQYCINEELYCINIELYWLIKKTVLLNLKQSFKKKEPKIYSIL